MRVGVAYVKPERYAVALDVDHALAFSDDAAGIDERAVTNLHAGAEVTFLPGWILGAGVFTDRAKDPPPEEWFDSKTDFYGVSASITRQRRYALKESTDTDEISFSTTFGVKYAVGLGDAKGLMAFVDPDNPQPATLYDTDTIAHELAIMVGSGLRF